MDVPSTRPTSSEILTLLFHTFSQVENLKQLLYRFSLPNDMNNPRIKRASQGLLRAHSMCLAINHALIDLEAKLLHHFGFLNSDFAGPQSLLTGRDEEVPALPGRLTTDQEVPSPEFDFFGLRQPSPDADPDRDPGALLGLE